MRQTKLKHLALALPLALFLGGCGGNTPTKTVGTYALERAAFVKQGLKTLIDSGRFPPSAKALGKRQLERINSILEIKSDGTFVNTVLVTGSKKHTYTGNWTQTGDKIELQQTQADGKDKEDSIEGTLDGDMLLLKHDERGIIFNYPMRKQGAHPSPK